MAGGLACSSGAQTHNGHRAQPPASTEKPPGPRGAPRARLPRAPGSLRARPLPAARPPPPARAASSRAPGAAGRGGRRRRRRRAKGRSAATESLALAAKGGPRSQLGAAAGSPGAEGVPGTGGARGTACPAQHCPSFPPVSPPTAGRAGRGAVPASPRSAVLPQTQSSRSRRGRPARGHRPGAARACWVPLPLRVRTSAGCLGTELFLQLFLANY